MTHKVRLSRILLLTWLLLAISCSAFGLQVTKQLAPGVTLYQDIETDPAKALIVNVITVDLSDPAIHLKAAIGQDVVFTATPDKGRETISTITARKEALVGINADYFWVSGDPLGTCIVNSELVSEPGFGHVALGVSKKNAVFFDNPRLDARMILPNGTTRQIDGINRPRETNQVVLYTDTCGASTQNKYKATEVVCTTPDMPVQVGKPVCLTVTEVRTDAIDTPIPTGGVILSGGGAAAFFLKENLKPGDGVTVRFDLKSASNCDWTQVEQAVGGGPWLVKDGKEFIDTAIEGFASGFAAAFYSRTAVGVTADNKLLIVTVDGRQPISGGLDLAGMSALMLKLGAVNAINLDGGGSTTMSVKGLVVNSPSEGIERLVANALLVTTELKEKELPKLGVSGIESQVTSGEPGKLFLTWGDDHQMFTEDQLSRTVWGTNNGIGFVNQAGYFIPIKARKGSVGAFFGKQVAKLDVCVVTGPPAKLDVSFKPTPQDPTQAAVLLILADAQGNRIAGKEVTLGAVGGKLAEENGVTTDKGEFSTSVTWEPGAVERSVKATVDALSQTVVYMGR
ncbi:MAG: phosphodiester glycosidase family protein [Armatimonadetes bacterium]|nr:phosphodiester glycosidase family protein [Armatimonadota bacterium]